MGQLDRSPINETIPIDETASLKPATYRTMRGRRRHGSLKGAPIKRVGQVKGDVGRGAMRAILESPHVGATTAAPTASGRVTARKHEDECFRCGRRVFTPADARAPTRAARSSRMGGSSAHRSARRDAARADVTKT
jgi:hypothetical protein